MFNTGHLIVSIGTLKGRYIIKKALKKVISSQSGSDNRDPRYKPKKKALKGCPFKGRVYCKDLPVFLKNFREL